MPLGKKSAARRSLRAGRLSASLDWRARRLATLAFICIRTQCSLHRRVHGRGGVERRAVITRYPGYGSLVTPDGRGRRESMNPSLVAPTRRDRQVRVVSSMGPPSGGQKRPSASSHPCPFSSSPSVLEGYVRAVPTRSTSPDPQPFRFSASFPSHTHTQSRSAAIWDGM